MSKIWIPGGGGGADLDVVTAGAGDVLSGKVIVDRDGNPLAGTMPNKSGTALTVATNGKTLIPQGYHDGTQYAKNTQATLAGGTLTPSTSQVTVNCNGKLMTSNYVIPAFSLPDKSKLISGYVYSIYGKSVTGTAKQFLSSPSSIFNNGKWGIASGITNISGLNFIEAGNSLDAGTAGKTTGYFRLNTAVNLTNYKYLKTTRKDSTASTFVSIGVSTSASSIPSSFGNEFNNASGNSVVDVTNLSGMYFVYFKLRSTASSGSGCEINTISLSNS